MDFLIRTKEFIEASLSLGATIEPALLSPTGRSIAILETPGTVANRYQEGKIFNINFQILVRESNFIEATNLVHNITDLLDELPKGSIVSQEGSFIYVKCEVYTTPHLVEKTDEGYIFTAMFNAELEV